MLTSSQTAGIYSLCYATVVGNATCTNAVQVNVVKVTEIIVHNSIF